MRPAGACLTALLVLLLSGCGKAAFPYAREMGEMALLRTMGVDGEEGRVRITVSTGPRASGLSAERQPPLVLSALGDSLSGACLSLEGQSDSSVFFGYVDQLLLGEEGARAGVEPVLDYFARDVELGLGAQVWLVRGMSAQAAIQAGGERGVEARLSTLRTDSEMGSAGATRTAGQVFSSLLERGCAYLPALEAAPSEEKGGESVLTEAGYAVLRPDGLAGYLDGESARGLELLLEAGREDILEAELSSGTAVVRISGAEVACQPVFHGDELTGLALTCRVEARLAEYRAPLSEGELAELEKVLEEREELRLEEALDRLRLWGTDCAGLGSRVERAGPEGWRAIQGRWEALFSAIPIEISVQATLSRAGGGLED